MLRYILITGLLFLVSLVFFSCKPDEAVELKVMAWNIWHGGNDESLPSDGRPSVVGIIKESGADVVLMIETYGSAPYIADSLGFEYHLISSNLCIFSRYPIVETYTYKDNISPFNFGGVRIRVNDRHEVNLFDTWLHYLPDTRLAPLDKSEESILAWENAGSRDDEIRSILAALGNQIAGSDTIALIMGGDFNSHSHLDWIESTRDHYNHGGRVVNWTISNEILKAGFIDTYRSYNPDPLIMPGTTWLSGSDSSGNKGYFRQDRIDYIYSMGQGLEIINSEAYDVPDGEILDYGSGSFMYPSDHGFVLTTFTLK